MATTSHPVILHRRICIRGIVQGVGFRPFVYNLAQRSGVRGFVLNSSSGVLIEAEGSEAALEEFLESLRSHPPPLAHIQEITSDELQPEEYRTFEIWESRSADDEFALVSPDVATCDDCRQEMADPENRRFGYPFTNCTNCAIASRESARAVRASARTGEGMDKLREFLIARREIQAAHAV